MEDLYEEGSGCILGGVCTLCPRRCGPGVSFCGAPDEGAVVAKSMVHHWEEPPISGQRGSGAVFFAGCNLRCAYCQNYEISRRAAGDLLSDRALADVFLRLEQEGVHNVNLVSPTPYVPHITAAVELARQSGMKLPVVYNTGGYDTVEALRRLDGLVDIYLPDIKYVDDASAVRYSAAPGYFETASAAVLEMRRQVPAAVFDGEGIMRRGLIIRHLILPGRRRDAMRVLDFVREQAPEAYVSLMAQYVPMGRAARFPEIGRRITSFEYDSVIAHFFEIGLQNGFTQERASAVRAYIPDFHAEPAAGDVRRPG